MGKLFQDSGQTATQRLDECLRICDMIEDLVGVMTDWERGFVEQMADARACSPKQLFILRDIKEKYL